MFFVEIIKVLAMNSQSIGTGQFVLESEILCFAENRVLIQNSWTSLVVFGASWSVELRGAFGI
jgi:hypothetical protein